MSFLPQGPIYQVGENRMDCDWGRPNILSYLILLVIILFSGISYYRAVQHSVAPPPVKGQIVARSVKYSYESKGTRNSSRMEHTWTPYATVQYQREDKFYEFEDSLHTSSMGNEENKPALKAQALVVLRKKFRLGSQLDVWLSPRQENLYSIDHKENLMPYFVLIFVGIAIWSMSPSAGLLTVLVVNYFLVSSHPVSHEITEKQFNRRAVITTKVAKARLPGYNDDPEFALFLKENKEPDHITIGDKENRLFYQFHYEDRDNWISYEPSEGSVKK